MKEKISLTIEVEILNKLDKEMAKHQFNNRSKFVEYVFRQVLLNRHEKLKLMERSRDNLLSKFKALNEDILILQDIIKQEQKEEELLIVEPQERSEKDALWQQ